MPAIAAPDNDAKRMELGITADVYNLLNSNISEYVRSCLSHEWYSPNMTQLYYAGLYIDQHIRL